MLMKRPRLLRDTTRVIFELSGAATPKGGAKSGVRQPGLRSGPVWLAHRPRRMLLRPWRRVCTCGFNNWPCYPAQLLARQVADFERWAVKRQRLDCPGWNRPTVRFLAAPPLTRGQAARAPHGRVR